MLLIKFDFRPEYDLAVAVVIFRHVHKTALPEVGINGKLLSLEDTDLRLKQFAEVVGQDRCGHTHGDTVTAQHKQTGDLDRQHDGLLAPAVVGIHEFRKVVVKKHFTAQFGKSAFDVTRSGGGAACNGVSVISLLDDIIFFVGQHHQSVPDGGIAVGVIVHDITDHIGSLVGSAVIDLFQSPEDTALDRFQSVVHIGDGTVFDNVGGIFQEVFIDHSPQIGIISPLIDSLISPGQFGLPDRNCFFFVFFTHTCLPSGSS